MSPGRLLLIFSALPRAAWCQQQPYCSYAGRLFTGLDGASGAVDLASSCGVDGVGGAWALALTARIDDARGDGSRYLFDWGGSRERDGLAVVLLESNQIRFQNWNATGSQFSVDFPPVPSGQSHRYLFSLSAAGRMELWMDGKLQGSLESRTPLRVSPTGRSMLLGAPATNATGGRAFTGILEDVFLFRGAVDWASATVKPAPPLCTHPGAELRGGGPGLDLAGLCPGPLGGAFSAAFSLKLESAGRAPAPILELGDSAGQGLLSVLITPTGELLWRVATATEGNASVATPQSVVGETHRFLVAVSSEGFMQLFMDGLQVAEANGPRAPPRPLQPAASKPLAQGLRASLSDVWLFAGKVAWESAALGETSTSMGGAPTSASPTSSGPAATSVAAAASPLSTVQPARTTTHDWHWWWEHDCAGFGWGCAEHMTTSTRTSSKATTAALRGTMTTMTTTTMTSSTATTHVWGIRDFKARTSTGTTTTTLGPLINDLGLASDPDTLADPAPSATTRTATTTPRVSGHVQKVLAESGNEALDLLKRLSNNESSVSASVKGLKGTLFSTKLKPLFPDSSRNKSFVSVKVPLSDSGDIKRVEDMEVRLPAADLAKIMADVGGQELAMVVSAFDPTSFEVVGMGADVRSAVVIDLANLRGEEINVANLSRPIEMTLPVPFTPGMACVFWDEARTRWSSEGVALSNRSTPGEHAVCETYHLSLFAVIWQGFLDSFLCSQLTLFNAESLAKLAPGPWCYSPGALLYWVLLSILSGTFLAAAIVDHKRSQVFHFREEYFLLPQHTRASGVVAAMAREEEEVEVDTRSMFAIALAWFLCICTGCLACIRERALRHALDEIASEYFENFGELRTLCEAIWASLEIGAISAGRMCTMSRSVMSRLVLTSSRRVTAASLGLNGDVVNFVMEDKELKKVVHRHGKQRRELRKSAEKEKEQRRQESQLLDPFAEWDDLAERERNADEALPAVQEEEASAAAPAASAAVGAVAAGEDGGEKAADEEEERGKAAQMAQLGSATSGSSAQNNNRSTRVQAVMNSLEHKDTPQTPSVLDEKGDDAASVSEDSIDDTDLGERDWKKCRDREEAWFLLHKTVSDRIYKYVTKHRCAGLMQKVLIIFKAHNPWGSIFSINIFMSCKMTAFFRTLELVGDLMVICIFYDSTGSAKSNSSDDGCGSEELEEQWAYKIGRVIAIATGSIFFAGLPVSLLDSLHTRGFRKFDYEGCPEWQQQLRAWKVQDVIIWTLGSLYLAFGLFFIALFLANVASDDGEDWTWTGLTSIVQGFVIVPFTVALCIPLFAGMLVAGVSAGARIGRSTVVRDARNELAKDVSTEPVSTPQ